MYLPPVSLLVSLPILFVFTLSRVVLLASLIRLLPMTRSEGSRSLSPLKRSSTSASQFGRSRGVRQGSPVRSSDLAVRRLFSSAYVRELTCCLQPHFKYLTDAPFVPSHMLSGSQSVMRDVAAAAAILPSIPYTAHSRTKSSLSMVPGGGGARSEEMRSRASAAPTPAAVPATTAAPSAGAAAAAGGEATAGRAGRSDDEAVAVSGVRAASAASVSDDIPTLDEDSETDMHSDGSQTPVARSAPQPPPPTQPPPQQQRPVRSLQQSQPPPPRRQPQR